MNESQQERALLIIAEKIDAALKLFVVGLETAKSPERKWYTPPALIAKVGAIVAKSSHDPLAQVFGVALYGSMQLLGVKGTMQLILNLRRKHNAKERSKKTVPGVRHGDNPTS